MTNNGRFFRRNIGVIHRIIRGHLARSPNSIVHGTRSTNSQLPRNLNVKTRDWDVKHPNPKSAAQNLEAKLDRRFRGNFFRVEEGATKKLAVHKIKGNIDDETYADFSKRDAPMPWIGKRGVNFATLQNQIERAKLTLKDPSKKFRREKDLSLIRRVKKFEKRRGKPI